MAKTVPLKNSKGIEHVVSTAVADPVLPSSFQDDVPTPPKIRVKDCLARPDMKIDPDNCPLAGNSNEADATAGLISLDCELCHARVTKRVGKYK